MIIYPAIDLKDGACVRLVRGEMDDVTVFNEDPADQARAFERSGFSWIHLVDLNDYHDLPVQHKRRADPLLPHHQCRLG